MMKKFLVLLMLLGTASMASATLRISIDGDRQASEYTIGTVPSGQVNLGIWTDAQITDLGFGFIALVANTSLSTIDITSPSVLVEDSGIGYESTATAGEAGVPVPAGEDGLLAWISLIDLSEIAADTSIFDSILFHCEGQGDVTVTLYDVDDDNFELTFHDSVIIHQVPEPITFGLLGLGGLFMRRRK